MQGLLLKVTVSDECILILHMILKVQFEQQMSVFKGFSEAKTLQPYAIDLQPWEVTMAATCFPSQWSQGKQQKYDISCYEAIHQECFLPCMWLADAAPCLAGCSKSWAWFNFGWKVYTILMTPSRSFSPSAATDDTSTKVFTAQRTQIHLEPPVSGFTFCVTEQYWLVY